MATFGSDTFTGTNGTLLTAHTSDSGHSWVVAPSETATGTLNSGTVWDGTNNGIMYLDVAPATADYSVSCTVATASSAVTGGPAGRISTSVQTFVFVMWNGSDWVLGQIIAGSFSSLATYTGDDPSTPRTVKLEFSGSNARVLIGGVERIAATAVGTSSAGRPGINLDGNANTSYLDNFIADQASGTGRLIGKSARVRSLIGGGLA